MAIQAQNNNFGSFILKQAYVKYTRHYTIKTGRIQNGQTTYNVETHICGRSGKSSNPITTVRGVPNYRNPSSYGRFAWDCEVSEGEYSYTRNGIETTIKGIPGSFPMNHAWTPKEFGGDLGSRTVNFGNFEVSSAVARSQIECLNRLGDKKTDLGVAILEARKSYDLIASTAGRLAQFLLAMKRGKWKEAGKHLGLNQRKGLSRKTLEFNYGWTPMMLDIYGSYELLLQQLDKIMMLEARRTIKTSKQFDDLYFDYEGTIQQQLRTTCGLVAKLDDTYKRVGNQAGLYDPLSIGWELVPWSFAIDWVLPVGDFLEAMHATAGLDFVSGWQSTVVETRSQLETPIPDDASGTGTQYSVKGFTFNRESFTGFPRPLPFYIKSPFKTRNAINAIALIRQLSR